MVGADTSTIGAYLEGHTGKDVTALDQALADATLVLPPFVITELLSRPALSEPLLGQFLDLARLPLADGFFERAGRLRRQVIERKLRARLADALIAQSCIDADVALITRDADFRHFAKHCGLKLA